MTPEKDNSELTFPQFDVVLDMSDHHFLGPDPLPRMEKRFLKAISKEWRILQENLPESIFVRVSETRSDLLRAAIIGIAGTPYHDALFFFDIGLPPSYPNEPPKVHYLSRGYCVNPNLKRNGAVCLSLLNTFYGSRSERWNPEMSTLLQVLLSIQSLVLNEEPYFNIPYNFVNWKRLSDSFSQNFFLHTCMTTVHLIRNPPSKFEPLITHHFRQRANAILAACDAYANGRVMLGFHGCDGAAPPRFKIPRRFQRDMERVYAHLVIEFRRIEAHVPPSGERLVVQPSKKPKGIFRRMIKNIRDALGLKKKNSDK
ncbi:hypothetical protein QN277_007428 [Acacia crassicarpa]|uniref:UBC core domain-containing protein n=1 Tax=Acacia crassicarpa TaxID=499986 RepID=A0AAE1JUL9_9FABA|nr:hypothetical protein QN277_007428 [Acacia crassicarpa]